ncbi:uncharacterized protein Z518_02175 [Rhinocladiella mackenziei CBS 650.93]|uniref:Uncharacterized protein n=1 Tax=Rhinocladiella mackenziei CBS 650.93 TaxID=1442369 RepID=A0A0D2FZ45_9EURO|nr:uncharacterized protein Z518_02175 [Rhinocladiella mackenziei CBS 650.93]KIX07522.1 hypothetical protein Z518_02175 [Rhinocladiella mackenziei CBS 650.93]
MSFEEHRLKEYRYIFSDEVKKYVATSLWRKSTWTENKISYSTLRYDEYLDLVRNAVQEVQSSEDSSSNSDSESDRLQAIESLPKSLFQAP